MPPLRINPGSFGPRRFTLPVSMAKLRVDGETLGHTFLELDV